MILFTLVSIIMQIGGIAAFTQLYNRDHTKDYIGMLVANQLTWGSTSFTGLWAMFSRSTYALTWFWDMMIFGFFSTLVINWVGMFWAQYSRVKEGKLGAFDRENLINLGVNLVYNLLSFGLHLWLQDQLCSVEQY